MSESTVTDYDAWHMKSDKIYCKELIDQIVKKSAYSRVSHK